VSIASIKDLASSHHGSRVSKANSLKLKPEDIISLLYFYFFFTCGFIFSTSKFFTKFPIYFFVMFYKYCGDIHLPYHLSLHFLSFLLLFMFLTMTMTFVRNCGIYCCLVLIYVCSVLFFQFCTNYFVHFCFVTVGFPFTLLFFGYFNKLEINFVALMFHI
jgi:hypothetical protein